MAELQFPDIGGNALGAYLQGQQRGKQSRLASLLGTAVSDPSQRQGAINQAAMIDPQAAMSARKSLNDESLADLARDAGMFVSMAQSGDQATLGQAYQQIAQKAQQVFGHPFPASYDPKYLPMIEKLAGSAGGGDDLKSLRIGANGNYWAIRGGQFIDTGTPADPRMQLRDQPGIDPGLVNLRTGSVTPLGGAPQGQPQQPPQSYAPAPEITMQTLPGADVPPGDEVAMLAAAQNEGQAYVPQANGGALPLGMGQQGGPAAARPAIAPAQQQQLQLAQQAAQRAQEASQRAATAQELQQRGNAPTGYRFKADGSLEPIPGAPASTQPGQRLSATALRQVNSAKAKLIDLQAVKNQLALVQKKFQPLQNSFSAGPFGGGLLPTEDGKRYDAAVSLLQQFVRKLTRTPGEGSMSDWEGKLAMLANPSRNDYESVTQDKIDQLNALVGQIEQGYQSLLQDNQADITGPKQPNQANGDQPHHDPLGIL